MKLKKKVKFKQLSATEYIGNKGFLFQWCCDCNLRHIWFFDIVRGKNPVDDYVIISVVRDDNATGMRRQHYKKK